jgi:hypothetical protein
VLPFACYLLIQLLFPVLLLHTFQPLFVGELVGLVAETLEGLPIITAFNQNKYFVATAANKIDEHHRALFNGESLNLWLAFYCDLYGAILVLSVCIFAVTQRVQLGAAAVGLAFSNTIQVR